jgi:hypothetical protein
LRALEWSGEQLYASRGYELLRATIGNGKIEDGTIDAGMIDAGKIENPSDRLTWQPVAQFSPEFKRRLSVSSRLTARLFRDGFHALAVLPSGGMLAAVAGAIVSARPNEPQFRVTHAMTRGTRPLHITAVPGGAVYWGEYFDNSARDEVHIYGSSDGGMTWSVAYTFARGAVRHVHNIVYDRWEHCLWVLTGDYGDECRILRAACDFSRVEVVLQGNQQARAVALVPMAEGLYFSSDTPLESNYIYRLDRQGKLSQLAAITSSSIYGCSVGDRVFFSTMIEPSEVNRDRNVRIFGGSGLAGHGIEGWRPLLAWEKDRWSMRFFQYGNAFLPAGNNTTRYLAVSTIAVANDDMATSLYLVPSAADVG